MAPWGARPIAEVDEKEAEGANPKQTIVPTRPPPPKPVSVA